MSFATRSCFIGILCYCTLYINAQVEVVSYTKNNGLTSSSVHATLVDSKGIVWIGTGNGICAFSGDNLTAIKNISDNNGYSKSIGKVNQIHEDDKNNIWIASEKGLFIYSGTYWTFFDDDENNGFYIKEIFSDSKGNVWVNYEKFSSLNDVGEFGFSLVEGIVQMYNGFNWIKFSGEVGGSSAVPIGDPTIYFTSHIEENNGNLWFTNRDGLFKFSGKGWVEYNEEQLPSDICNRVMQSKNGNIWVGTKYGISRLAEGEWTSYENVKSIKHHSIADIYEDNNNRIWIVTKKDNRFKNVCYFEDNKWKCFKKDKIYLRGSFEQLIINDSNILVLSQKNISYFKGKGWHNFENAKNDEQYYQFINNNSKGCVLIAGKSGVYKISDGKLGQIYKHQNGWSPTCIYMSKDAIWVGTERKGVFKIVNNKSVNFNEDTGLPDNYVKEVFTDSEENIWVVTKTGISILSGM